MPRRASKKRTGRKTTSARKASLSKAQLRNFASACSQVGVKEEE
jgi:ribosomal protein S14